MYSRSREIFASVIAFAVVSASSTANADDLVAPPIAKTATLASALPDELEGFRLGEPLADLRVRLEADGWKLTERPQKKRAVPILRVYAKHRSHALLRKLQLHFAADRLVSVKTTYRRKDPSRAPRFEKACADLESVAFGGIRRGCVDAARTRILEYDPKGRRAELVDLATGLKLGVITRAKLERRLREAKEPPSPRAHGTISAQPPTPAP